MIIKEKLSASLNKNTKLSGEIKENIDVLITVFNQSFPSVSLENLSKRLETLEIEPGSKLLHNEAIEYVPATNRVVINKTEIEKEEVDAKYNMMKVILAMVTAKDGYYGFGNDSQLKSLNIGINEVMANYLVGNEGKSDYLDEQAIVNMLASVIGSDNFIRAFFTNDAGLIKKQLYDKSNNMEIVDGLLEQVANNMYTRKTSGVSQLYHIQKQILSTYGVNPTNLMSQEALEADTDLKYTGVNEINQYLQTIRQERLIRR